MQKKLLIGFAIAVALIASAAAIFEFMGDPYADDYRRLETIQIGMTDVDVIRHLGKPHWLYYKATATDNYYVKGWTHKKRPITNKVFIYNFSEPIAYYYFDDSNKVEDIFIGGS